jgi:hypothetical protein
MAGTRDAGTTLEVLTDGSVATCTPASAGATQAQVDACAALSMGACTGNCVYTAYSASRTEDECAATVYNGTSYDACSAPDQRPCARDAQGTPQQVLAPAAGSSVQLALRFAQPASLCMSRVSSTRHLDVHVRSSLHRRWWLRTRGGLDGIALRSGTHMCAQITRPTHRVSPRRVSSPSVTSHGCGAPVVVTDGRGVS